MDKSAIQEISSLAIQAAHKTDQFVIVRDDQSLVALEKFEPAPDRFRGTYTTNVVSEFSSYLNDHGSHETSLYIDYENGKALAIVDQGTILSPLWGQHRALLSLKPTPEYADLLAKNGHALKQQDFIDLVEDYASNFQFFDEFDKLLDTKAAIQTLRQLKVETVIQAQQEVRNFGGSLSAMEEIEVKSGNAAKPPAGFKFIFAPHEDFDTVEAVCQLRADVDKESKYVWLKYRIMGLETLKKAVADHLLVFLDDALDNKDIKRYLGTFSYQA